MTKRYKRVGAFALALAMSVSLVLGSVPALAAPAATTTPDKPKLVMDFLGDNKVAGTYYDRTAATGGGLGDGSLPTPQDSDQAWQSTADDGQKWNGYVQADAAANASIDGTQTIFWMGIGIQDVDKFVLSKDTGLYSAEIALFYNPQYVEPYDGNSADGVSDNDGFRDCIEANMLGNSGKRNQWPSDSYKVVKALTDQEPLNDTNDASAQGDFTAAKYGFAEGYGTEEFHSASFWRMAYISVEMTEDQLTSAAWLNGSHDSSDTYYIAMVPFVLRHYDPNNELCIRLARNASTFSIGSKKNNGMGSYGDSGLTYGNWDKYTYHDPAHDLKLMLDYTGDLNIFTNEREIEDNKATLVINNGGNSDNKAQMIINNEPLATPSQIADATGEQIIHLSGGEELRVSAKKMSGFTVAIEVRKDDGTLITPVSITAVNPWTDEWTFLMPDAADVTVTVTFVGKITTDTKFKVDLEVIDNNYNEPNNTAKLTAPGGLTTQVLTTGTDSLSGDGAPAGTKITVSVTRNSDYNVKVTLVPATGSAPALTQIIDQSEAQTYTFLMPPSDMRVKVEFELKTPHKATLAVQGNVASDKATLNYAKMGYTDGQNTAHTTEDVSFADAKNSPSSVPGLDRNQIQSASGRTIYIDTVCSPEYQISGIIFRKSDDTIDSSVTATLTTTPGRYAFTMPDYEIKVIVVYELVKTYRVRLLFDATDAPLPGEGAILKGTDARGTVNLSLSKEQYDALVTAGTLDANNLLTVFPTASMGVSFFHDVGGTPTAGLGTGRTAEIKVYYPEYGDPLPPNTDEIIPSGSAGSGYSFNMRPLTNPADDAAHTDAVYVVVHFKAAEGKDLTARIYNDRPAGMNANNANAVWAGAGHNNPITVHENDQLTVSIRVDPGIYIASIQVYDEGAGPSYVGAPLGIPVTLSGIGYNNGQGGTETASFIMPNQNATIVVKYARGTPPEEPAFTATIRKAGDGNGSISIKNETKGTTDTHTAANAKWVDAETGNKITATYKPDNASYVAGVTVTADVPGTTITWTTTVNADGSTSISVDAMPSANVVIAVTFAKRDGRTPFDLTLMKVESPANSNDIVTVTTSLGQAQVAVVTMDGTEAYENEVINAVIDVDAGWHIVSATATLDADGSDIPVTLSGNGYNGGAGGTETATFQMPAGDATLIVEFAQGAPANTITLVVVDPNNQAGNTATLYLDGTVQTPVANAATSVGPVTAAAGTPVKVVITEESGYAVDLPILTTPSGVVSITWTAVDTFEFVMPDEPLTVTVPFLPENQADKDFYANLIFRDGDGDSAAGVAKAKGTFLDTAFTGNNYADQLDGTLKYSRSARPGEDVPFAVRIPDGYYISDITVTPADFGVEATITGMIGTQRGEFLMPAGNVRVNVYLAKGWPDEAKYHVTLHVEGPDDQSTATMKNVTASPVTTLGPLPVSGQSSGSGDLTAMDGDKIRVTLYRDSSHDLESITIVDGNEVPVSYRWTTDGGDPAVEFSVPGSSVDVYVKYTKEPDTNSYNVRLFVDQGGTTATAAMTKNGTSAPNSFTAQSGDDIGLTVSGPANALITYAYAITNDGTMVGLGDPALAGTFANAVTGSHGFIMPFHTGVDVFIGFKTATPGNNEYSLTLQVNGDANPSSGTVTVREFDSNNIKQGEMSATAVGGNAMLAHGGNKITAEVVPAGGYALYSLIAYTSTGERVVVSLDTGDNYWRTYTFTMPEDTTHIEAEFRKVEPEAYQIQVVVNNTVNNGAGNNDAFMYEQGALQNGFKFKAGVSAGDTFDLGFIVDTGYQVESILAVPQGSGVAANIPLPATSSGRTQVKMPASNLVIYVTFRIDSTTRYNVIGTIDYLNGVTAPTQPDSNTLKLVGSLGVPSILVSNDATAPGSIAMIQEAKGNRVDATWTVATGYVVSSYTVTTSSGKVVLSQPNATNDGCFFYMPAEPVEVNVIFTMPDVEPPTKYTATLHYLQGGQAQGDLASIEKNGAPTTYVDTNGGVITSLNVGDQIDIAATPGSGRYIQTVYVLQNGPAMAQMGQTLPLQNSNVTSTSATGDFFMPSGNVDVYVVFTAVPPQPDEYMATVKVNADGGPNTTNYAVISTSPTNQATANCNSTPASIVAKQQDTVTVRVTVDSNHVIDSVTGTPITPSMQPQLSSNGSAVYTFTMPANNASVIVNLKQKEATKYKLYLHVANQGTTAQESDNVTKLEYGEPVAGSLVRGQPSGTPGAAPTASDPVIPYLNTPGGSPVTLTVEPDQDYYVKAAYVVYENGLVTMIPASLPSGYANNRSATGLEGTTPLDIGVAAGSGTKPINTATFTMPNGNADVYVVYEKAPVPTTPWYNVVVIATDSGGTPGNAGHGRVTVSSAPAVGTTAAIDPAVTIESKGLATYFYSVPYQETIHLDASVAYNNYQYDTSTGMVLTYQTAGATAAPPIAPVDTANHPRGDVQEFGMPKSNVGVHINFTKTGTTGLWAQLHVVQADGVPGYNANTVTLSTGVGTSSYRYVDNHELTAAGPTGDVIANSTLNPDTTNNMILKDLTSQQLISTLIHPRDSATRVVQVTVTQVDKSGNIIGSTFATHAGDPTNSGQDWYNYIMGENDVHVYVVLAKKTDTDRFVAVATPSYGTGITAAGDGNIRNEITGLTNTTTAGLSSAPYWTEVKAKDRVKVTYIAQTGVYVEVKAYRADNGTALADPVEFGVGNGAAGYAYVDIPDPGCDVEIQVIFSTTPPSNKTLSFVSHDHAGKPKNETELQKEDPANAGSYIALSGALTPSAGVLTDLVWPVAPATDSEKPGTNLKVLINDLEPGYEVKKVEIKVNNTFTIDYYMKDDPQNAGTLILVDSNDDPVNLVMPNGNTVITVHFKEKDDGLVPYDPRNKNSTDYKDHWIKAENRGDYLIVTVPLLNNIDGNNPTSVTWTDKEKEDRFKFYLDETPSGATTPVYTSIDYILKRSRPADAPAATSTEPYWKDNFLGTYYDPDTYEGAQFILEIMSDKEIDDDNSITNKAAAKTLAATLRKIMDNDGTKANGDKHSLYISCEETTYKSDGTVDKKAEGAKVDFEVPRYYALIGMLESYAPAHIATFTLTDEATGSTISFTSKLEGTNGVDLWQQDFKVKLTSDFDGKLKDKSFTLTIEKAGHVTYTRTSIVLDTSASAPAGTYDATDLTFMITDSIHLFCGDIDNNGFVEQGDVQLLIAITRGHLTSTKAKTSAEAGWENSVYNPDSLAYASDLNGDRRIDVRDMNIVLDRNYYGHDADDYGAPTGLTAVAPQIALFMAVMPPQWYMDMIIEEIEVPLWAETMVQEQREIPEWVGELLKAETVIPEWVVTFVTTNVIIPDWAAVQVTDGKLVPEWAVDLIRDGEELPPEMEDLLAQGEALPETKPEETPVIAKPLDQEATTVVDGVNAGKLPDVPAASQPEIKDESAVKDQNAEAQKTPESIAGTEVKTDVDDASNLVVNDTASTKDDDASAESKPAGDNENKELPSDDKAIDGGAAEDNENAPADGETADDKQLNGEAASDTDDVAGAEQEAADPDTEDASGEVESDSSPASAEEESGEGANEPGADADQESAENTEDASGLPEEPVLPEAAEDILYTGEETEF